MTCLVRIRYFLVLLLIVCMIHSTFSAVQAQVTDKLIIDRTDALLNEYSYAMGLYWSGEYESAELSFQEMTSRYPKYTSAYIWLADCQRAQDNKQTAFKNYEKAYLLLKQKSELRKKIIPGAKEPEIYSDMVYCLNAMGRYKEAKKVGMYGTLKGKSPDLFINMAYTFTKLGQLKTARENFCKSGTITTPKELQNLTYQRLTKLFENSQEWALNCSEDKLYEKRGTNYALIIAVGKYRDPKINSLRYAENDARELYRVLTNHRTGMFKPRNVTVLINQNATEKNIKFKFDDIISKAKQKDDLLLVFYAGHGFTYPSGSDTYWLTYDTIVGDREGKRIKSTAFSNLTLATKLTDIKANTVVFFVDACFSSGMVKKPASIRGLETYLGTDKDYVIITSSQADQRSIESSRLRHGLFSYSLIKGLSGEADVNSDGLVDIEELWPLVTSQVSKLASDMNAEQQPRRGGSSGGSIYLSKNPNY